MMFSRINVFQRLARQWDEVHPYNAAQVLKISGAPPAQRIAAAWHDTLNDLGLGRVHVTGGNLSYECLNGEMSLYGARLLPPGINFEGFISEQLNRRFDNPAEPPFRPFILPQDGFYYMGVVYHHWIADSVSIRGVLREWFARIHDPEAAGRTQARLAGGGYRDFFGIHRGAAAMGQGLLSATRWASTLRNVRRVEIRTDLNLAVRFGMFPMPDGWIDAIHAAARRRGVMVNDLFMAAIASVCDRFVPMKRRPRRQSVAIGSIVDLRPYSDGELADVFGLFLGFTNVVCRPVELRDPERLVQSIALQSRLQKERGIPQTSALRMLAGVTLGRLVKPDKLAQFYQKHLPMAGGISNVNLNRCWATQYHPAPLLDYIRISPTGPMMPLVFATTTLGRSFHVALTYRPSIVCSERVDEIARTFRDFLSSL
jgi:hypothetical protein